MDCSKPVQSFDKMTPERWLRIKEISADALECSSADRARFVATACAADTELHEQVVRILAAAEQVEDGFLEDPPWSLRQILQPAASEPSLVPGQVVASRFEITRFISRGGMGEVYCAFDRELKEHVALKTIIPKIAKEAIIERFKHEVRQSRRITHPNVCRVYDLFSHETEAGNQLWFLTMELLNGRTLAERLASDGALKMEEAVPLICDIVAGLSAAHAIAIVHRDLKPGNIMLVKEGRQRERALVMDFGLAVQTAADGPEPSAVLGGTPAYMAPEQASGLLVGPAADQFALGILMCEMLTGERPDHAAHSGRELEPFVKEWLAARNKPGLPAVARNTIERCLAFDPKNRFENIGNVTEMLSVRTKSRRRLFIGALAAMVACGAVLFPLTRNGFRITRLTQLTAGTDLSGSPSLSTDGKWIAYMSDRTEPGNLDIWLQQLPGGAARRLTTHPAEDTEPAISSDGTIVAFRSERDSGGIYLVNADGTGEKLLVPGGRRPRFSPVGRQLVYWTGDRDPARPSAEFYILDLKGGEPRRLAPTFADARNPIWSSDGRQILFEGCQSGSAAPMPECQDWWVVDPGGGAPINTRALQELRVEAIEPQSPPEAWYGDEVLVSAAHASLITLWKVRLSGDTHRIRGQARQVTTSGTQERALTISVNGQIAFGRVSSALHVWRIEPAQGAAPSTQMKVTDDLGADGCPSVSLDGKRLFLTRHIGDNRLIVTRDLQTGREAVISNPAEQGLWPVPDRTGDRVVYESRGKEGVSIRMAAGSAAQTLCSNCSAPSSWFEEHSILYGDKNGGIGLLDVSTRQSRVFLSAGPGIRLGDADWNPATGFTLFTSRERGKPADVLAAKVILFPTNKSPDPVPIVSGPGGAEHPRWARDGRSVLFLSKRDGFFCIWGQAFDPSRGVPSGQPYPVAHYHNPRLTPDRTNAGVLGLAVSGRSILVNVGEVTETIWIGWLPPPGWRSLLSY
jgi:tRNA A-37 threonylcarbamoyl transferase component Bud32